MQSIKFDNKIIKRNGQIVSYDITKISYAVSKALSSVGDDIANSDNIALSVENILKCKYKDINDPISIEVIQDIVEQQLMGHGYFNAARSFIVYREEHKKARSSRLKPDSSSIEDYIFTSKYARYLPEQKRRETFVETCSRVRDMFIKKYPNIVDDINWAFEKVFDKYCLPSMRAMQFGGTPIEKHNARLYNCSFSLCDRVEFFSEAMYLLMCGVGVGFSVEFEHVEKLPILVDKIKEHDVEHFVIEDTIEGWADSVKALINSYLTGKNIEFCYTLIRPFGSPLKSSGGRAPGHIPLRKALDRCRTILDGSLGRKLKPIECYDIVMHCSDAVLAGGVRRSACICLFSQDDGEMINSKRGNWFNENPQRARSNNSVKLIRSDVTKAQFLRVFQKQKEWGEPGFFFANHINHGTNPCVPKDMWVTTLEGPKLVCDLIDKPFTAMVNGVPFPSTEKGFFKTGNKKLYKIISNEGINARFTENHKLLCAVKTKLGGHITVWKEVKDLSKTDKIILNDHKSYRWCGNGNEIEGWILGNFLGDGTLSHANSANLSFWGKSRINMTRFGKALLYSIGSKYYNEDSLMSSTSVVSHASSPRLKELITSYELTDKKISNKIEKCSSSFYSGFLRGWFDADGSVQGDQLKGVSIRLTSVSLDNLQCAQRMLLRLGIYSKIYKNRRSEEYRLLPDGKGGKKEYLCKDIHELIISNESILKYRNIIGFVENDKRIKLEELISSYKRKINFDKFFITINSIVEDGIEDVYDCTIPGPNAFDANGIYAHNCAEIVFDPTINILGTVRTGWQFCNLTEINGSKLVDAETFKDAVKAATIIGTCQAGFTSFPYLGKITEEICKRDALLGVSITGMMENPDIALCPEMQNYMANYAIEINKHYSNLIDINPASRVTCVKPAGTTSLVLGTASGIHPRHARRYFRRVQANINDPVYKYFKQHNPHMCEKSIYSANNTDDVITFCIESSEKAIVKKDIGATELLMHVLQTQMNWVKGGNNSDPSMNHNVSNTITVEPNEWDEVAEFIWNNRSNLTGVTTLSATGDKDYPQVPHEEIVTENDEIKWNNIIKNFKHVDYTGLVEEKDNTELKSEAACAGGSCALV